MAPVSDTSLASKEGGLSPTAVSTEKATHIMLSGAPAQACPPARVLMIAPTSFFADYGCHVRIYEQARGLAERGHQIAICTYHTGRDVPGLDIRRTARLPWRTHMELGATWHRPYLDAILFLHVLRVGRVFQPTILHSFLHEGALIGSIAGRLLSIPHVADIQGSLTMEMVEHGTWRPHHPLLPWMERMERWIDGMPALLLANTAHMALILSQRFGVGWERIRLVPDGVDAVRFHPPSFSAEERRRRRTSLGIPPDAPVIAYLGLLAPHQGLDILLKAFAGLPLHYGAHLLIMGFPTGQRYQQLARDYHLEERVHFTGPISYFEAHTWLGLGDIALAPKLAEAEGSGKLLNYMAMGMPAIAFDTPVSREYLEGIGMVVPAGDAAALTEAMETLLADPELGRRMGAALRARAERDYPISHTLDAIESLYAEIGAGPERPPA